MAKKLLVCLCVAILVCMPACWRWRRDRHDDRYYHDKRTTKKSHKKYRNNRDDRMRDNMYDEDYATPKKQR